MKKEPPRQDLLSSLQAMRTKKGWAYAEFTIFVKNRGYRVVGAAQLTPFSAFDPFTNFYREQNEEKPAIMLEISISPALSERQLSNLEHSCYFFDPFLWVGRNMEIATKSLKKCSRVTLTFYDAQLSKKQKLLQKGIVDLKKMLPEKYAVNWKTKEKSLAYRPLDPALKEMDMMSVYDEMIAKAEQRRDRQNK